MNKIKNIIIYYPSFERGGATFNLINFINATVKKNINVHLISNINSKNDLKFFSKKVKIYKLSDFKNFFFSKRVITSLSSLFIFIKLILQIDKNSIFFSFQSHILPLIVCSLFRKKIVIRNSEDVLEATKYADKKLFAYIILLLKIFFYFLSDGIITNSIKSKKSLEKITFFKKKIKLIYNPYLFKIFKFKNRKRKKIILSVGRLCKQKNQTLIIKAFKIFYKKNNNYKLFIIGDGQDKQALINLSNNLKIKHNVVFKSWNNKLGGYYKKSKLLVFPSLYEGLPNTLIDALNFGLPSLTSKCSGASDIFSNKYKFFINTNNPKKLSEKLSNTILNYTKILKSTKEHHKNLHRFLAPKQVEKYLIYLNNVFINKH